MAGMDDNELKQLAQETLRGGLLECPHCHKPMKGKQGLATHLFRAHGIRTKAKIVKQEVQKPAITGNGKRKTADQSVNARKRVLSTIDASAVQGAIACPRCGLHLHEINDIVKRSWS